MAAPWVAGGRETHEPWQGVSGNILTLSHKKALYCHFQSNYLSITISMLIWLGCIYF